MLYRLTQLIFRLYFLIWHRVSIRGLDELKRFLASRADGGTVILAANHASYLDPPLVGMAFPRPLRFVAWDGLFRVPVFSSLIRALGAVPVNQENKSSAASLLRQVMGFIEDGYSVLIFPEGMRSPDGKLLPLEGGVALIASKTDTPIVPVWLQGTYEAYPIHYRVPHPKKITVVFGAPILPEELSADMSEKERRRALLERLQLSFETMRASL